MTLLRRLCALTAVLNISLGAAAAELYLTDIKFVEAPYELSGMRLYKGHFIFVSDNDDQQAIYKLAPRKNRNNLYPVEILLDLRQLTGFSETQATIDSMGSRFDLEGVSVCGDDLYLANERARLIHRVTAKAIETLKLDWRAFKDELTSGGDNTGFEGVAVDCGKRVLYVAKERQPRMIYVWNLKDLTFIKKFDVESEDYFGNKLLKVEKKLEFFDPTRDFADLYFSHGALYALERNARQIVKIDPQTQKVMERYSYTKSETGLYSTTLPFGLAEGMAMDDQSIYLSLDNNNAALTHATKKKYKVNGNGGVMLTFARPDNF